MSADEVIIGALDAFSAGDRAAWEAAMTPDVVYWEPCTGRKLEGVTQVADGTFLWKASWPDLRHTNTRTITQGDEVCVGRSGSGTRPARSICPTARPSPQPAKKPSTRRR